MKSHRGTREVEGRESGRRARKTQDPQDRSGRGTVGKRRDVRGGLRDRDDEQVVAGKQEELELGLPLPFPVPHRSAARGPWLGLGSLLFT